MASRPCLFTSPHLTPRSAAQSRFDSASRLSFTPSHPTAYRALAWRSGQHGASRKGPQPAGRRPFRCSRFYAAAGALSVLARSVNTFPIWAAGCGPAAEGPYSGTASGVGALASPRRARGTAAADFSVSSCSYSVNSSRYVSAVKVMVEWRSFTLASCTSPPPAFTSAAAPWRRSRRLIGGRSAASTIRLNSLLTTSGWSQLPSSAAKILPVSVQSAVCLPAARSSAALAFHASRSCSGGHGAP
jgi:hypothetical protein